MDEWKIAIVVCRMYKMNDSVGIEKITGEWRIWQGIDNG